MPTKIISLAKLSRFYDNLKTILATKVDKVTGKGLSTNDYTTAEKTKLAGLNNYDDSACTKNSAGTAITSGTDLDAVRTIGAYACTSASIATSLVNCPYTNSGFRLDVFQTSTANFLKQVIQPNQTGTDSNIYHRSYSVSSGNWSAWYKITSEAVSPSGTNAANTSETI